MTDPKTMIKMAKLASDLSGVKKSLDQALAKLAVFEKRAEAESFLLEMMARPDSPQSLVPRTIDDFLDKRHVVEGQDIKVAKLAAAMASGGGYEVGEAEENTPLYNDNGSKADAFFTEYLLTSQG